VLVSTLAVRVKGDGRHHPLLPQQPVYHLRLPDRRGLRAGSRARNGHE